MSWTDDRVTLLKKLWVEGKTAAEIAKALGGITRNAVIGKAHRLKLSNRISPIQQNNKKPVRLHEEKRAPRVRPPIVPPANFAIKGIKLVDLKIGQCHWPVGDPKDEDFKFCGCAIETGFPYCEHHVKVAYQTPGRSRNLQVGDFDDAVAVPEDDFKEVVNS